MSKPNICIGDLSAGVDEVDDHELEVTVGGALARAYCTMKSEDESPRLR